MQNSVGALGRIPSVSFDQQYLDSLTPHPDRNSTFVLERNRTVALIMHDAGGVAMTATLRKVQSDKAFVQFTYQAGRG